MDVALNGLYVEHAGLVPGVVHDDVVLFVAQLSVLLHVIGRTGDTLVKSLLVFEPVFLPVVVGAKFNKRAQKHGDRKRRVVGVQFAKFNEGMLGFRFAGWNGNTRRCICCRPKQTLPVLREACRARNKARWWCLIDRGVWWRDSWRCFSCRAVWRARSVRFLLWRGRRHRRA